MSMKEKNRRAVAAQVAKARTRANAAVSGNVRALLGYFRSGNAALIPEGVSLGETKAAAAAVREEDYASAGNLPGVLAIGAELGLRDCPRILEYIERIGKPVATDDAGILSKLGIEVLR
jgi:hypothetical protein